MTQLSEEQISDLHTMVETFIAEGHSLEYGDPQEILKTLETILNELG